MSEMRGKIWVTTDMTGKMKGKSSISSSCCDNTRCQRRSQVKGSICEKCYARPMLEYRQGCRNRYRDNLKVLSTSVLDKKDLPRFYEIDARIESHGETQNKTHAKNYFNIVRENTRTEFGWWTKNTDLTIKALDELGYAKPENLTLIKSSMTLNKRAILGKKEKEIFDIVFTVYTFDYLIEHPEIEINCGFKICADCGLCYGGWKAKRSNEREILFVNEIQKKDQNRYKKWLESKQNNEEEK